MKKIIVLFAVLCTFLNTTAQTDSCKLPDQFDDYYRYGKSKELLDLWQNYAAKCTKISFSEYAKGEQILQFEYDNAASESRKEKQVQLVNYYISLQKLFPEMATNALVKRALLLSNDKESEPLERYQLLHDALFKGVAVVDNPLAYKCYFDAVLQLESQKNNSIDLVAAYLNVKSKALQNAKRFPNKADEFENLVQYISTHPQINERVTCVTLEKYTKSVFESKSNDFDLCIALTNELYEKCQRNPTFLTLALYTYQLKETPFSSYLLGMAKLSMESLDRATPYLFAAVDLEENPAVKADRASNLAPLFLGSDPGQSASLLKKAMQADPKNPNYPLLMSEIYQASIVFCEFEGLQVDAVYYLASQAAAEAAKIDPKYAAAAQKKEMAFIAKMKMQPSKRKKNSVNLGCWINKTVTW
jgi:hypothetical protein